MHRPGSNPLDMQITDFLCDFCEHEWREDQPFIEGHHGSCLCGDCLRAAVHAIAATKEGDPAVGGTCTMCLEVREEAGWASPKGKAWVCARCVEQAARVLSKDRASGWTP